MLNFWCDDCLWEKINTNCLNTLKELTKKRKKRKKNIFGKICGNDSDVVWQWKNGNGKFSERWESEKRKRKCVLKTKRKNVLFYTVFFFEKKMKKILRIYIRKFFSNIRGILWKKLERRNLTKQKKIFLPKFFGFGKKKILWSKK